MAAASPLVLWATEQSTSERIDHGMDIIMSGSCQLLFSRVLLFVQISKYTGVDKVSPFLTVVLCTSALYDIRHSVNFLFLRNHRQKKNHSA